METEKIAFFREVKTRAVEVLVDESRLWDEAVRSAGPDTRDEYLIWKVGVHYPARVGGVKSPRQIVLANFGNFKIDEDDALLWAREQGLSPASPRACFAVGEQHLGLLAELAAPAAALVSLESCSFQNEERICIIWWDRTKREVCSFPARNWWGPACWFVFVREEAVPAPVDNGELTQYAGMLK